MSIWYRVFGAAPDEPAPAALLEHLQGLDAGLRGRFTGDDQGWLRAELTSAAGPVEVERYLVSEEGIRAELNNWAAWVETQEGNPHQDRLMRHLIATQQVFTLPQPGGLAGREAAEALCVAVCRFLARATAGVYQVDLRGFFAADGTLLMPE